MKLPFICTFLLDIQLTHMISENVVLVLMTGGLIANYVESVNGACTWWVGGVMERCL